MTSICARGNEANTTTRELKTTCSPEPELLIVCYIDGDAQLETAWQVPRF